MSKETILSLLLSVPIGIISGLYAGVIVARYQRFADLRLQAKKIILEIDFIWEDTKMVFPRRKEIPEFSTISSDLFFLGHKSAGTKVLEVCQDIQRSIMEASAGRVNSESFNQKYISWQREIRSLSPEMLPILRIWGGL
ncbi:MAG: hypothetical protein H6981_00270 [Gammaproteobacteria bacterium]|nr:hypothetical protein [Gammaproteobacteria bacterium]